MATKVTVNGLVVSWEVDARHVLIFKTIVHFQNGSDYFGGAGYDGRETGTSGSDDYSGYDLNPVVSVEVLDVEIYEYKDINLTVEYSPYKSEQPILSLVSEIDGALQDVLSFYAIESQKVFSYNHNEWAFVSAEITPESSANIDEDIINNNQSKITITTVSERNKYSTNVSVKLIFRPLIGPLCKIDWSPDLSQEVQDERLAVRAVLREPPYNTPKDIKFPVDRYCKLGSSINIGFTTLSDFDCDYNKLIWDDGRSDNSRTFTVPANGIDRTAVFHRKQYTVQVECENGGIGGYFTIGDVTYTSSTSILVYNDETVTVFAHANDGWRYAYGEEGNTFTANCDGGTIHIYFINDGTHLVSVLAPEGEGCVYSIDSTGGCHTSQTKQITHGVLIYLLAKGENCHKFLRWTGIPADKQNTNGVYVVVNSDMTIAAVFEECPDDGRLIHCKGDILFDPISGMPLFQVCDCS